MEEKTKQKGNSKKKTDFEKSKFVEWGKLGGRPKEKNKKTKRIHLIFTEEEYLKILSKAKAKGLKHTDFLYYLITDKDLPNFEQNKDLIKFSNNFVKISNFMKMGIFNTEEKNRLLKEIEDLIKKLNSAIKW